MLSKRGGGGGRRQQWSVMCGSSAGTLCLADWLECWPNIEALAHSLRLLSLLCDIVSDAICSTAYYQ